MKKLLSSIIHSTIDLPTIDIDKLKPKILSKLERLLPNQVIAIDKKYFEDHDPIRVLGLVLDSDFVENRMEAEVVFLHLNDSIPEIVGWISSGHDSQMCSGYFVRDELIQNWGLSVYEASLFTFSLDKARFFLDKFGWKLSEKKPFNMKRCPRQLNPKDKVLLVNKAGSPLHCTSVSTKKKNKQRLFHKTSYLINDKNNLNKATLGTWRNVTECYKKTVSHIEIYRKE